MPRQVKPVGRALVSRFRMWPGGWSGGGSVALGTEVFSAGSRRTEDEKQTLYTGD